MFHTRYSWPQQSPDFWELFLSISGATGFTNTAWIPTKLICITLSTTSFSPPVVSLYAEVWMLSTHNTKIQCNWYLRHDFTNGKEELVHKVFLAPLTRKPWEVVVHLASGRTVPWDPAVSHVWYQEAVKLSADIFQMHL